MFFQPDIIIGTCKAEQASNPEISQVEARDALKHLDAS
jgi:hypothetical protein